MSAASYKAVDNGTMAEDPCRVSIELIHSEAHSTNSVCICATGFGGEFLLKILKSVQYRRITSLPLYISCQVFDKMCSTNVDMES